MKSLTYLEMKVLIAGTDPRPAPPPPPEPLTTSSQAMETWTIELLSGD